MSEIAGGPQLSGKLYLFRQPELLNAENHKNLGITPQPMPYAFCAKSRIAPLTINEMGAASKHFPIVFTSMTNFVPMAVLGVLDDVNLFVDEAGNWDADGYAPAYFRRYPFAFANQSNTDRYAVVIDRGYEGIGEKAEKPFFEGGAPSEAMQQVIEFCKAYEAERLTTEQMMKALEGFNLISGQAAQVTKAEGAQPQSIAQYFGIDSTKLEALSDEAFTELRRKGLLPIIYAQLLSVQNWRTLFNRRARRFNLTGDDVFVPRKVA